MKSKFIEFARLPDRVFEVAIEEFDDADERTTFLKILAVSKICSILTFFESIDFQTAIKVVELLHIIDERMVTTNMDFSTDHEYLKKMVEEFKNDSRKAQETKD